MENPEVFNEVHKQRLLKLADHLLNGKLGHEKFNINCWNVGIFDDKGCGTAGCAIGECPIVFPESWEFNPITSYPVLIGMSIGILHSIHSFFGLSRNEKNHLFHARGQKPDIYGGSILSENATKEEVANNIKIFVELKTKTL